MPADGQRTYRIHEFATLTGVSVRALHHYDRLGLLKPRRAASGYRLYVEADVGVLEQIVALKFIGVPLREVKRLLRTAPGEFKKVLAAQRTVLEEKRRRLDLAIAAIRQAQEVDAGQAAALTHIIEVIDMQENQEEFKNQYDALLKGKIERLKALSPDAREQLRGQFAALCQEIQDALDQDPAGPRAQELAGRWLQLLGALSPTAAVDPQLLKYEAAYISDRGWPAGAPQPEPPYGKPVWEFMAKAIAARSSGH
jgi:MerR family transcriptional regulator, thiopeptide resistance regulator